MILLFSCGVAVNSSTKHGFRFKSISSDNGVLALWLSSTIITGFIERSTLISAVSSNSVNSFWDSLKTSNEARFGFSRNARSVSLLRPFRLSNVITIMEMPRTTESASKSVPRNTCSLSKILTWLPKCTVNFCRYGCARSRRFANVCDKMDSDGTSHTTKRACRADNSRAAKIGCKAFTAIKVFPPAVGTFRHTLGTPITLSWYGTILSTASGKRACIFQ